MGPPLRIAVHNGAHVWGGAEIATARLVVGLARRGHEPVLYCGDREVARRAAELGAPTTRVRLGGDLALHDAIRFARQLRRQGPQVVLLATFRKLWLGAMAARLAGVPRTVARIGLETDLPRNMKYRVVFQRWIDTVVFTADVMRLRFMATNPAFPGRVVTILTGVGPLGGGQGDRLRAELGIPPRARLVGSVGRLAEQKRYDRLVRAVSRLPEVHLLVLGDGPERAGLEALATELGMEGRLHLPGHRDDVASALDAMDVFVLCSEREGLSNAMLEALSAGVPVVSTDVSGAREALTPAPEAAGGAAVADHLAVAPGRVLAGEPDELMRVLAELLRDEALLAAMGQAARRAAADRFQEERMLDEWESLLRGSG
jgi:glycosyltransferase involved in cell wall biosynthesis